VLALAIFISSILIGLIWDRYGADNALLFSLAGMLLFFMLTVWKSKK